jgi:CheY-like chemotaxis protein
VKYCCTNADSGQAAVERDCFQTGFDRELRAASNTVPSQPEDVPMKFLIVDPARASREWIARLLHAAGHSAISLQDGQQGLQALAGGHYDCVITDLAMPVVDGLEMIRRMRCSADMTRVIVCANEISDAARAAGQTLGIAAFLTRPITPEHLLEQLTAAVQTSAAIA